MFEKSLTDLVTGIRSHKRDTALFISQNIAEIKVELQSPDFFTKSNALQKLTFLQMMGYTMSWAAFAAVEVMSSPRFALKRVGYLAACQGLDQPDRSPVVLLTTNLLKKELRGATVGGSGENTYHAGLAINCLSNIVTEDLGRELLPDLLHLLKHPCPYVRKKALLCLYKVFLKYPQGLRLSFDQIKLCLEDAHPGVVSCAVNVVTELSDKNPKNYLPLAPAFFKLLTSSANNWMLIKVVKLLGSLVPEEPRLARKLLDPLSGIVKSTHAKSLLYESAYALTLCLQYVKKADGSQPSKIPEVVELCVDTLRSFVSDSDQNLKYLGLVGFGSLLKSQPYVLHSRSECRSLILKCLSDDDVTIRARALGLLRFMTTQRNLVDLITQLLGHVEAAGGEYRSQLVEEILRMCSSNKYSLVVDFAWYVDVLVILAGVRGVDSQGEAIAKQWMDMAWRVLPVRVYAVRRSLQVLTCRGPGVEGGGRNGEVGKGDSERHVLPEVLPAAAWAAGEYSHLIPEALENEGLDPRYDVYTKGPYHALIQSMTDPNDAAGMNPLLAYTQAVFVQSAMKVFAAACRRNQETHDNMQLGNLVCSDGELHACSETLMRQLPIYAESIDVEVKERAFTSYQLLLSIGLPPDMTISDPTSIASKCHAASPTLTYLLTPEPAKPVSTKAQRRKLLELAPPSALSVEEWDMGINWDAFSFLEEEIPRFDREGNARGSVEDICFTSQWPGAAAGRVGGNDVEGIAGTEQRESLGTELMPLSVPTTRGRTSSAAKGSTTIPSSLSHQREGDPFYLSSSAAAPASGLFAAASGNIGGGAEVVPKDATKAAATRFGSIELDSGCESDERRVSKSRKKKTKKKGSSAAMRQMQEKFMGSDDDDDGEIEPHRLSNRRGSSAAANKDFHNLALVDLTTPLGEHEVMPRNEHHVVQERRQALPKKDKKKKAKSSKATKKSRKREAAASSAAVEGDLLGLVTIAPGLSSMGFGARDDSRVEAAIGSTAAAMAAPGSDSKPVNNAFDDLLGLEMPTKPIMMLSAQTNETVVPAVEGEVPRSEAKKQVKKPMKKAV